VLNRGKLVQRRRANLLRRRVRRRQFWMRLFEVGEPAKEPVIVRVTDQRVVENVVLKIVFLDLLTQLEDLFLCGGVELSRRGIGWRCRHNASGIFRS
jgi:hypothetical protein